MFSILSTIARHWPFANGSGRFLDKFCAHVDLGSGQRTARTSDGFPMQVYADDLIGRHLLMSGAFGRSSIQVLLELANPGDVFVDIGANIGYYSAVFLSNVKNSTAICFEPQPGVVDLLRANVGQFTGRSTVHELGLGDKDGELRFQINHTNRGASRVSPEGELSIPVRNAATVFAELTKADLIKIDVEGYEEPIFRAIQGELRRLKPRAILFEDHGDAAAPEGALGSVLQRAGYTVWGVDKRLFKTELVPINSRDDCRFIDYLAQRQP